MKIQKADLLQALNAVKPGLATKTVIQQMENVLFTGQDMITYNDQICVLYPFETDFTASVNYNDLYKIANKVATEDLEVTLVDNELRIKTKSTKAGLLIVEGDEINDSINELVSQLPNDDNEFKWQELYKDFMEGALLCIPASSHDMSQGTLACLYTNGSDLICTDNLRVSWFALKESMNAEFFIKAATVRELAAFEFTQFCVSGSWVHFQTGNSVVFSTRLIRGKALDYYKEVFDGFKGSPVELPDGIKSVIDSASVMADDDAVRDMTMVFKDGELICSTKSARGWIEKTIPVSYKKKTPVEFMISATFLQQIVSLPVKMTVGENKSLFESGNFKHVLIHRVGQ